MKKLLTFLLTALLAFSVGWAETSTLTFNSACGGSGTADDGAAWTVESDAAESTFDSTKGIHYGTSKAAVSYLTLTSSSFSNKTITKIVVNASGASSTTAVLNVTVGGSAFGSQTNLSSTAAEYTFNGSASGEIVVRISQQSAKKALYCKSITITYEAGGTQPAEPNWYRKVTDLSDLEAGKKYIFITGTTGMGAINNNGYGASVTGLTIDNNRVNIGGTDISEFTLGGVSDAWTFKGSDEKYLGTSSTSSTVFSTSTNSSSDGYKWKVTSNGWIQNNLNNNYIRLYSNSFCFTTSGTVSTIYVKEECATPTFNPGEGTYTEAQNVSISCATSGATIYYTTDGSTPTTSSAVYSSAIPVSETTTIKAIAVASGYDNSTVAEATYTINSGTTPTGTIYQKITSTNDLTDGNYLIVYEDGSLAFDGSLNPLDAVRNTFEVTISDNKITTSTPGYFTYDATAHSLKSYSGFYIGRTGDSNGLNTSTSEAYTNSISFDSNGNANIVGSGGAYLRYNSNSSDIRFRYYKSSSYTNQKAIQLYKDVTPTTPKVATPTFTPEPGTYTSAQNVTISCATEGATIHYTYNGGAEQTGTSPITLYVNSTAEIVAWATLDDYEDSDPVPATYTINLTPTLTASPTTVNINDDHSANGRKGSFTVTGTNIGTDNVGVTRTNDKFTPALSATTGTTYAGEYNGTPYWGFTPAGSLNGSVEMTYNGHALSATTAVTLANAEGANHVSAVVNVNYLYTGPIYIMGNVNETGWAANNGEPMVRDESTGNYSKTLSLLDSGDGHAYISFTKALANGADDWNSIAGDRFGPESNGNWTFNENLVNEPCALDTLGGYWSIKVPTGEWVVSIDPNTNTFTLVPHVPAPVFDPAGGRYETAQDVEITCTNVDAHIYYTTDGSTPSANNGTLYTGPITVSAESTTIKAIAIYGNASSTVTTATYTIKPIGADDFILVESDNDITAGDEYVLVYTSTTGVHHAMSTTFGNNFYEETTDTDEDFTLADGVVTLLQDPSNVNVLTLEEAGDYFYIKDHDSNYLYFQGSSNNVYRAASNAQTDGYKWQISINGTGDVVINNVGFANWYLQSNPQNTRYACYKHTQFDPKLYKKGTSTVLAPQITPAGGTSNKRFESVEVTITAADGCRIYYTTDGTAPSVNSTEYTGVFVLPYGSAPTTVKAIAVDGEGKVSRVTTVVYYWDRVQVSISPASKEVVGNVDVTITPSPSDATVTYTINGGEPQTYNGQFTVQVNEEYTPVTVEATAVKGESTATASVTYTYKDGGVNSIAEFLALDNNEERFFKNPVVVLFDYSQNGDQDYIWVKDRTGYMKLFIQPGFDEITSKPRYNNGDVIPEGFTVKKITYTEHDASFIEGKSDDPSLENFKTPKERALADPEQVKLSELLANPANYTVASDENGDDVSEVFGTTSATDDNDIICYNKFPTWKEKDGTGHTVTIPSGDGNYYNVKFIFQKYGSVYEIMPIEFTPWVENKVRLEDLVKIEVSTPNKEYTISNDLIATKVTWDDNKGKFAIFAKDDEAYASPRHRLDGQESYFIRYENVDHPELNNTVMQEDYDQSNWVEILIPSAIDRKLDDGYQSQLDEFKSQFENKILPGGSIRGTYIDKLNPTIEYNLNLSELPSNLAKSAYKPNIYTPVNFLMENLDDEGSEAGAKSYRTDALGNQYFFMMDAKPHETCMVVWGYYPGDGDYFYIPERIGDQVNGHQFHGIFKADMSLCEDPNVSTANGSTVERCFPEASDENGADMGHVKLFGFDAIVRKNPDYNWSGSNGAPRRVDVAPYTEGQENVPAYIVYPLNAAENASGIVTSVEELNVLMKDVESVRYYNIMGMESEKPFEGINIVVTRYTDGSTSTAKILR